MIKITVDKNLMAENCEEKGYQWVRDAIYDPDASEEVNDEFFKYLDDGWRLGRSASQGLEANGGVGLYRPLGAEIIEGGDLQ